MGSVRFEDPADFANHVKALTGLPVSNYGARVWKNRRFVEIQRDMSDEAILSEVKKLDG